MRPQAGEQLAVRGVVAQPLPQARAGSAYKGFGTEALEQDTGRRLMRVRQGYRAEVFVAVFRAGAGAVCPSSVPLNV